MGINVLNSFEQELLKSIENGDLVIQNLLVKFMDADVHYYGPALNLDSETKCGIFVSCLIAWWSRFGERLHAKYHILELIAEGYWSYAAPQARARLSMKAYAECQRDMEG